MECLTPRYLSKQEMVVPCGKCAFCAATRRADWSTRLEYEARLHPDKYFVTLTYANPHLKWSHGNSQLCKRDLQLWFKRVRKSGARIRYYAVGEYGSTTFRPHYHVILFGSVSERVIREAWPLGQVHIGTVTQASIMYCLGYIVNKSWKHVHNRVPPFALMSRKPGLGHNYLTPAMRAWHKSDRKNYVMVDGVKRHLPRYYKTKIFSKLDLVRIAVRDQNAMFNRMVEWIRHPLRMAMADPLAYRKLQMQRLAESIRMKSKQNLSI
jgi:hypothetical protein